MAVEGDYVWRVLSAREKQIPESFVEKPGVEVGGLLKAIAVLSSL